MDIFRRGLKIEGGALYGKRFLRPWVPIDAEDIRGVREYCWNNPFIKLWTRKGNFAIGAWAEGYDAVVQYLEDNTAFEISGTFAHKYNSVLYRLPLSQIFSRLFARRKQGSSEGSSGSSGDAIRNQR